ncbi:MAG: hypothetical protein HUU55_19835 [Myxococcales bacterium]|nr:hypothetical protein [Myxococcales bacterium]
MPPQKTAALGDIVEVYCTRCRLNLDANVAAVLNGDILKVHCRTCGNFVPFKPPVDMQKKKDDALKKLLALQEKKRKGAAKVVTAQPDTPVARNRWADLTEAIDSRSARPYDRHRSFKVGDFVLHKGKGIGYVESCDPGGGTMVVLFKDGLEQLTQNEPRQED